MLQRIIYTSTFHPHITLADVDEIVSKAASFNKSHDITGILAIEDKRVCQILEGPQQKVEALFNSILGDPRHYGVTELVNVDIKNTSFDAWGMVRRPMLDIVIMSFDLKM